MSAVRAGTGSFRAGFLILWCIALCCFHCFAQGTKVFDITGYGAVGDGATLCTQPIQAAIDDCNAAGGGVVRVPAGRFVTGTIFLRSNVTLDVSEGATLLGSPDIADYSTGVHKMMYLGESHMDRCLIFARDAVNIGIVGRGVIDGQGQRDHFPNADDPEEQRPMLIRLLNCERIVMRDIKLRNPAAWASAWLYCQDIVVDGITVESRVNWNGDGLDFDGCENVRVSNSRFDTSDDSICLQASRQDRPCRNIVVNNCVFSSRWAGMRIGLLSLGDFENVVVSNCLFQDIDDAGLKIQMCEGGEMKNMIFSNLVMKNVPRPLFITFNRQRAGVDSPVDPLPMKALRNLQFTNIRIETAPDQRDQEGVPHDPAASGIIMTGVPEGYIEDILLSDITYTAPGGGTRADGAVRAFQEFTPDAPDAPRWPEYSKLGARTPAYGIYARHVKKLTIRNVSLETANEDLRPAIVCDDVIGLELDSVKALGFAGAESLIRLQETREAFIHGSRARGEVAVFCRVEGAASRGIAIAGNDLRNVQTPTGTGAEVPASAVQLAENTLAAKPGQARETAPQ